LVQHDPSTPNVRDPRRPRGSFAAFSTSIQTRDRQRLPGTTPNTILYPVDHRRSALDCHVPTLCSTRLHSLSVRHRPGRPAALSPGPISLRASPNPPGTHLSYQQRAIHCAKPLRTQHNTRVDFSGRPFIACAAAECAASHAPAPAPWLLRPRRPVSASASRSTS
jgi:hypothetical protein